MPTPLLQIVAGWTGQLGPFTLKVAGSPLPLTGMTVTLSLRQASGTIVTPGGTVTKLNQASFPGQVTYSPVAADFTLEDGQNPVRQTYTLRWKVVDAGSKVVYFPNSGAEQVVVHRA